MSSRRRFIKQSALTVAGVSTLFHRHARAEIPFYSALPPAGDYSINIFSKNLHWLDYENMARTVKAMGFDGVDLTVRPEGHVLPERVVEDLPKAVRIIRKEGLNVHMITTSITSTNEAYAESILKTASSLEIPYYRMGWISYDDKANMGDNLKRIQGQLTELAALNRKYAIRGQYQNHSGTNFGAPVWDLANVLTAIDSPWIGSQYDILHATIEGANAWPLGLKRLRPYIGTMDIKDFKWIQKNEVWQAETVPLGEGMVDLKRYFRLIKDYNIRGPFSLHFEYPLGGAENGARTLTINKEEVIKAMVRDLGRLRVLIAEASLL